MDLFLKACGLPGPLRLHICSPDGRELAYRALTQPFALLGRDLSTDVSLNHPQVSRRHAYLQVVGGRVFCIDLQSRTGTRWDGRPESSGWLDPERAVEVGPYQVRTEARPGRNGRRRARRSDLPNPLSVQPEEKDRLPAVALEFLNGQTRQTVWPMRSALALVGRLPRCQVCLVEPSVSRFHCSLVRTPDGVWVVDLFGRQGVRVNDQIVRLALLQDGDQLQVGRFRLRLRCTAPARRSRAGQGADVRVFVPGSPREQDDDAEEPRDAPEPPLPASSETVSLPAVPLRSPEPAALTEAVLVPLLNQFNQMQQQMFDQFHQSIVVMFQMFTTLHRDQVGVLREELDRLHDLNRELQVLQGQMAASRAADPPSAAPAPSPPSTDEVAAELLARVKSLMERQGTKPAEGPPTNGSPVPSPAAEPQPLPETPRPPVRSDQDIHAWLYQRIASIQQERETRWQRILHFMLGK